MAWYETEATRDQVCATLVEMLHDRGYRLRVDFDETERDLLVECALVGENAAGRLIGVHFCTENKMSVGALRSVRSVLDELERLDAIVVVQQTGITPYALKEQAQEHRIESFMAHELMFNVTRHEVVPPHRALDRAEARAMLEHFRIKRSQLPLLPTTDPVARYYGWRPGTVVRIDRKLRGFEQTYYRLVTQPPVK